MQICEQCSFYDANDDLSGECHALPPKVFVGRFSEPLEHLVTARPNTDPMARACGLFKGEIQ